MMRVLVDTNVLIDFLAQRAPFFDEARKLLIFAEMGDCELWASASQISDIFYVLSEGGKASKTDAAKAALISLRGIIRICAPGEEETDKALESTWSDFKDALLYQAAMSLGARCIITRNTQDFILSSLPVYTCQQFFTWMEQKHHLAYKELTF